MTDKPQEAQKHDIQSAAITALSGLISYHKWLDVSKQRIIFRLAVLILIPDRILT